MRSLFVSMKIAVIRSVGKFRLLLALAWWIPVADPSVDCEILLLRWNLCAHCVTDFFDGNRTAFLSCRWSRWSLFHQLRWLLMFAHMYNVRRSWNILRQGITVVNDVVRHRPPLVRRLLSVLCRIVP